MSSSSGPTKGKHEQVPQRILAEAERLAKNAIEGDDEDEAGGVEVERMEE